MGTQKVLLSLLLLPKESAFLPVGLELFLCCVFIGRLQPPQSVLWDCPPFWPHGWQPATTMVMGQQALHSSSSSPQLCISICQSAGSFLLQSKQEKGHNHSHGDCRPERSPGQQHRRWWCEGHPCSLALWAPRLLGLTGLHEWLRNWGLSPCCTMDRLKNSHWTRQCSSKWWSDFVYLRTKIETSQEIGKKQSICI